MRCFCIFLTAILPFSALAQSPVSGRVFNDKGEPLAFASVRLNRNGIGTLTNEDGRFRLYWADQRKNDTLLFSFLGFEEKKLAVKDLQPEESVIKMIPSPALLEEIKIVNTSATELVRRAVSKIAQNYYQQPHVKHGFYRIHTQKGEEHLMLSEAVFDIFDPGYSSSKRNSLKLLQMRSIQDEEGSHGVDLGIKPKELYRYDIIHEPGSSDLLDKKGLKNHTFRYLKRTTLQGRPVYQVAFDQRDGLKESLYTGILYIDVETEAFVAVRIGRSPKGIRYAKYGSAADRTLLRLMSMQIDIGYDNIFIQYQLSGEKWVLASVQNETAYRIRNNRRNYDFTADIRLDYIITGIDTVNISAFSNAESLGDNRFIEHQDQAFTEDFWKDHNILLADYNSDTIAAAIRQKNENGRLKNQLLAKWKKIPANEPAGIDSILSFYHQRNKFSGTALVSHKGQTILLKGYGLANESNGLSNTASTQFRIGSLSKTFTSMLILQLTEEGKCRLSDSAGTYLSGYMHGEATLEQLLTHSSGIPSYSRSQEALAAMTEKEYAISELLQRFGSDSLEFEPGTAFRYSNTGYLVLAAVIEKICAKPFAQVLQEKILTPLNMSGSGFGSTSLNSRGYWMGAEEQLYPVSNMAGAGGMYSTVEDLQKWEAALHNYQLLSKKTTDLAFIKRFAYSDWDAWYGYGWMIDEKAFSVSSKYKVIYHPGTDLGYYSMFVMIPETETLIILLSNHGDFARYDITELLLKVLKD